MREITPALTPELQSHTGGDVVHAEGEHLDQAKIGARFRDLERRSQRLRDLFSPGWTGLEQLLVSMAQRKEERIMTVAQATRVLRKHELLADGRLDEIERLRQIRNRVVHGSPAPDEALRQATERIEAMRQQIQDDAAAR